MIGDNPVADIGGARACGARTVWMRKGDWPAFLDYRPDHTVDAFADAVRLVLASLLPQPIDLRAHQDE